MFIIEPKAAAVRREAKEVPEPSPAPPVPEGNREGSLRLGWGALLLPNLLVFVAFLGYPIADVLIRSFTTFTAPQVGGLDNYVWYFETDANIRILVRTVVTGAIVTAGTVLLAYPYAYFLTLVGPTLRRVLIALVLVPFWTSLMVRNFAWVVLLQPRGPINNVLDALGFGRLELLGTTTGVVVGEVQILLPFVVLPLYARLRTIDRSLLDAAASLGAPPWRAFLRVYLPLSLPGVLSGALLAFVLSLGFYITPALLGGSQQQLLSPLIVSQVTQTLALGRAGAMAAVLLVVAMLLIALAFVVSRNMVEGSSGSAVEPGALEARATSRPVLAAIATLVGVLMTLPSLVVIPMSFTDSKTFAFPPAGWSLRWWDALLSDPTWVTGLANSLMIALVSTCLATVLGTAAALGLARSNLPGVGLMGATFVLPLVVPLVVAAVGVYSVYLRWHLVGTFWGLVLAHTCLAVPLVIVPVATALRGLDRRLENAAASLGATPWTSFWSITAPLIRPAVLAGALFAFVTSLDETVVSLFLVSPEFRTLPVNIFSRLTRDVDPTVAAASTVMFAITTAIIVSMLAWQWRHDRQGGTR